MTKKTNSEAAEYILGVIEDELGLGEEEALETLVEVIQAIADGDDDLLMRVGDRLTE